VYVYYIFGRDAISAKSLVQQLAAVIKDAPKLFTINVEDKEEAYFSSLIASSKYIPGYQRKNFPYNYVSILPCFDEQHGGIKSLAQEHNTMPPARPQIKPRPLAQESSTLTMRPLCFHILMGTTNSNAGG